MSELNIERGFISKLLETKDMLAVKEMQIKPSYFMGEHRKAFQFIADSFLQNGEVPTVRVFEKKFPNYSLEKIGGEIGTEESLKFWGNELRKKVKHNSLAGTIEEVVKKIERFDTDEAYKLLKKEISYIENEVEEQLDVDITKNTEDRVQAYLKKKENQGMLGISYGFPQLDYLIKGLKKETLTVLIATTATGKTWFEILVGAHCQMQHYKVLQLVTEMSGEIMRERYEATLFSLLHGDLNYNDFKSGKLSPEKEKEYFHFLLEELPNCEPLILATASGVMGVSAEIEKYNPDIVLIDSVYLMEDDENAKDDWLRVAHITRGLKKLAKQYKIPIFINTQADKNTSKKVGPELESIMYTQAIGQDADDVMALFRDEIMINDKEMCLKLLKQREGTLGKIMLNWDFTTMNFSEIYAETGEAAFAEDNNEIVKNTIELGE